MFGAMLGVAAVFVLGWCITDDPSALLAALVFATIAVAVAIHEREA